MIKTLSTKTKNVHIHQFIIIWHIGGVAQMVERSLSMREVPGSIPGASKSLFDNFVQFYVLIQNSKVFMQKIENH